jgi:hypothetical protein
MDENPYKSPASDGTGGSSITEKALEKLDELFQLRNWRIGTMLCVIIAALVTPADPYSLLFVAPPLVVLYFFAVGLRAVVLLLLKGKDRRYAYMAWAWFLLLLVVLIALVLPR